MTGWNIWPPFDTITASSPTTVEWAVAMSADRSSLSVWMVNSNGRRIDMPIRLKGVEFAGEIVVKSVTIPLK